MNPLSPRMEHHGQESTADDDDIAGTQSVRGKACQASHSRAQQRPTGVNDSQEEGAQREEMTTGSQSPTVIRTPATGTE
jgi:hypothetical protein